MSDVRAAEVRVTHLPIIPYLLTTVTTTHTETHYLHGMSITRSIRLVAERVLCKSRGIDDRVLEVWNRLKRVNRWRFVEGMFSFAQGRCEEESYVARKLKNLMENCYEDDFKEIKKTKYLS